MRGHAGPEAPAAFPLSGRGLQTTDPAALQPAAVPGLVRLLLGTGEPLPGRWDGARMPGHSDRLQLKMFLIRNSIPFFVSKRLGLDMKRRVCACVCVSSVL